jgi:clan AA aspartic protease (TIGR02281 family)
MPAENGSTYDIAVYLNGVRVVGLFDTGASAIVLPSAMTRGLRLYPDKQSPEISAMVASGEEIMVRQYWAQTASIGGLETRGVRVWVIDANVKPLIGQSLLSRFSYSIDNSTQTLTVSAR